MEWVITGDDDRDATGTVQYRVQGSPAWRTALPLVRVDLGADTLAGSILFLAPGTTYEVAVSISDPDGGAATQTVSLKTKVEPIFPAGGRALHVVPGSGGGDGSAGNPFKGFATAWSNAAPGDMVFVHGGSYGTISGSGKPSGAADRPIVFTAAGDGAAVLEWVDLRYVSYIWFDGLTFNNTNAPMPSGAQDADDYTAIFASLLNAGYDSGYQSMSGDVNGIVITHSKFNGYRHAIRGGSRTRGWFIADNMIVGNRIITMTGEIGWDGEGVELGGGSDHVIAYNSITLAADAISPGATASRGTVNLDVYGNDIFNVSDDCIELDGSGANTRVWGNRMHNCGNNGISFQPQTAAPWYIIRNQLVNAGISVFKFVSWDRFMFYNNTFVNWSLMMGNKTGGVAGMTSRNNLWIVANNGPIWQQDTGVFDWRTNLDYDGFDWGTSSYAFNYLGSQLASIPSLTSASGQEAHGIRINRATCFQTFNVPGGPRLTTIPPQFMTLNAGCPAVDAGVVLANINDGYAGSAPDLGAYELGAPLPQYGPRSRTPPPPAASCDVNGDSSTNVVDVQLAVNQALGTAACSADINKDGVCNVVDVQRVVNAALGGTCSTGP